MENSQINAANTNPPVAAMHPNRDKMPNLDGVRATACLLVIMAHLPLPGHLTAVGALGVAIFFVLSGFLMGYLYGESAWNTQSVVKYGIARFSRIAPIYWVVIAVCLILTQIDPNFILPIEGTKSVARHVFFSGNVGVFWSIPLEVQYYVFFIFVWWGISYKLKLPYALPFLIFVCAVLMLSQSFWPHLSVPNKLHLFLAGTIAGMAPRRSWISAKDKLALSLLQIGALIILIVPYYMFRGIQGIYDSVPLAVAYAIAIYLLSISSGWTNFLFANPVMRKIGQASFSIYLLHLMVLYYGEHLLGLNHKVYDHLWLFLGVMGAAIPIIISMYIEMPLQRVTRNFLTNTLLPKFQRKQSTAPIVSETALNS
ncbi:MAG: acyltransferase [Gammaproteobacteria bacterium]|nr:MAG: acyltransferase [Gammaproteobacteria bacterium]